MSAPSVEAGVSGDQVPFQPSGWMLNELGEWVYAAWEIKAIPDAEVSQLRIDNIDLLSITASGIAVIRSGAASGAELVVH